MANTNGIWTEKKIEQLKKLRAEGQPFSEISRRLRMSRSSCIGKANRLGLSQPIETRRGKPKTKHLPWNEADPRDPEHGVDTRDLQILDALMTGALPSAVAKQFGVQESLVRELWRVREAQEAVGEEA